MTNKTSVAPALAITFLALSGCADDDRELTGSRPSSGADQAYADCKYQAERATVLAGADRTRGGDHVPAGFSGNLADSRAITEHVETCMAAKGYRQP